MMVQRTLLTPIATDFVDRPSHCTFIANRFDGRDALRVTAVEVEGLRWPDTGTYPTMVLWTPAKTEGGLGKC
jgi:hypothetical protein